MGKVGENTEENTLHNLTSLTCADTALRETGGSSSSKCEENHGAAIMPCTPKVEEVGSSELSVDSVRPHDVASQKTVFFNMGEVRWR
jgi:hypothetical protein